MKKIHNKRLISIVFIILFLIPGFIASASPDIGMDYARDLNLPGGGMDLRDYIVKIIRLAITFLGILATTIIMLGGFKWMVSGGSDEKIDEAKKVISSGVVGMVITLSAFMLVSWIVNTVSSDILS